VIGRLKLKKVNYNKQRQNMMFVSLLKAVAATIRPKSYLAGLPPAVGVVTAKCSFYWTLFCRTFHFFLSGILTTANLRKDYYVAEFPAETKDQPLSQDGFLGHGQCPVP
jgi:hypothetical protein